MAEAIVSIPLTITINVDGEYLTVKIQESTVTVRMGGRPIQANERLKLERGQTLFDIVLESAKTIVRDYGEKEFTAADLYHTATDKYPDLKLRRGSFSSHVVSSAPNHSSYRHYTAKLGISDTWETESIPWTLVSISPQPRLEQMRLEQD